MYIDATKQCGWRLRRPALSFGFCIVLYAPEWKSKEWSFTNSVRAPLSCFRSWIVGSYDKIQQHCEFLRELTLSKTMLLWSHRCGMSICIILRYVIHIHISQPPLKAYSTVFWCENHLTSPYCCLEWGYEEKYVVRIVDGRTCQLWQDDWSPHTF